MSQVQGHMFLNEEKRCILRDIGDLLVEVKRAFFHNLGAKLSIGFGTR